MTDREKFEAWFSAERKELIERKVGIPTLAAIEDANWKVWRAAWQAALASHQQADDGWMPCHEKMPDNDCVECHIFVGGEVIGNVYWDGEKWADEEYRRTYTCATHWMESELPAGPRSSIFESQVSGDGWIEWAGGECPVKLNAMVDVRHRSEKWCNSRIAAAVADWRHKSWCPDTDIIAYRVVKP